MSAEEALLEHSHLNSSDSILFIDLKLAAGETLDPVGMESIIRCAPFAASLTVISHNHRALQDARAGLAGVASLVGIVEGLLVDPLGYVKNAGLAGLMMRPQLVSPLLQREFAGEGRRIIGAAIRNVEMFQEAVASNLDESVVEVDFIESSEFARFWEREADG